MPAVTIDLDAPELERKIRARFEFSCAIADELNFGTSRRRLLNPNEVAYAPEALARVTEAYFLLSEAYKVVRLGHAEHDARRTMNPKKAALTALAVFAIRPFRLTNPGQAPLSTVSIVANLLFALDFSATVLGRPFAMTGNMQLRLFRFLAAQRLESLRDYLNDQEAGEYKSRYVIDIEPDLPPIEMIVLFFEQHALGDMTGDDD